MHREPERGQLRQVPTWAKELRWDQASSEPDRGMTRAVGHSEGRECLGCCEETLLLLVCQEC